MNKQLLPLIALLFACSAAPPDEPPPTWLVGTYRYSGSGNVVRKFPWQAQADLVLDQNSQYTLSVTVHIDDNEGGDTDTDESYGSYYVRGDHLILQPVSGDDDGEEFVIKGNKLVPQIHWAARLALKGFRIPDPVFSKAGE